MCIYIPVIFISYNREVRILLYNSSMACEMHVSKVYHSACLEPRLYRAETPLKFAC